jgi:hypothetical protein
MDPARTVARLFYEQDRLPADVTAIMHCLFPKDGWTARPDCDPKQEEKRITRKMARFVRDGDKALSDDDSPIGVAYREARGVSKNFGKVRDFKPETFPKIAGTPGA